MRLRLYGSVLLLLVSQGAAVAQNTAGTKDPVKGLDGYIDVPRKVTVTDPRALRSMLERLSTSLGAISFVDKAGIASAIGKIEGSSARSSSLSVAANLAFPTTTVT